MLKVLRFRPILQIRHLSNSSGSRFPLQAQEARKVSPEETNEFLQLYQESVANPSGFWRKVASELHFEKFSENGLDYNFDPRKGEVFVKFMEGSITNVAYNCLERNIIRGN